MKIVYARDSFPTEINSSIFLAGPTPRSGETKGWRDDALKLLEEQGYDGHVFIPEPSDGSWAENYDSQVEWEEEGLQRADCILFWVPRDMDGMPGLTTNDEWGAWKASGKCVFGAPPEAVKVRYQQTHADWLKVPSLTTLEATTQAALEKVTPGADRTGGECQVPLEVWVLPSFQAWLSAQKAAGNRLDGARVEYTSRISNGGIFLWCLWMDVHIASEGRNKQNEFVVGRPDISAVVLWRKAATMADTEVVLVREFRSPARTPDAFIWELPAGSSKETKPPIQTALEELVEETGIQMEQSRLKAHPFRQNAGTLSSFGAHVFSAEISAEELADVKSKMGVARGVESDSERCFIEVEKMGDLLQKPTTDWSTLGMIFNALSSAMR